MCIASMLLFATQVYCQSFLFDKLTDLDKQSTSVGCACCDKNHSKGLCVVPDISLI